MQKILRISIYISVLAFYNLTTLYTGVIHEHKFSWTDDESCSAYLISVSHNSDTSPFVIFQTKNNLDAEIINFQDRGLLLNFDFINISSTRAPPHFI